MARILILSSSNLEKDPRVLRQIKALKAKHEIITCGVTSSNIEGVKEFPILLFQSKKQSLFTRALNLLKMLSRKYEKLTWNNTVYRTLIYTEYDIIIVNDPREMALAVKIRNSQKKRPKIYFDLHEYFMEVDSNEIINKMYRTLTDKYQQDADSLSTVSDEIANLYQKRYNRSIDVITNAGMYYQLEPRPVSGTIKIVHHGVLNRSRKIEEMIELMKHLDDRFILDFYLVGTDTFYLKELKEKASFTSRINFRPPVAYDQIVPMLHDYDMGLFILSDQVQSYKYALPNKIFEFVQARLAVAISPNISMKRFVEKYKCGIVAKDFSALSMAAKLNSLSTHEITEMKNLSGIAAKEQNEDEGCKSIENIINSLLLNTN